MDKDFTSISPSAWLLLQMKAETTIPYARDAVNRSASTRKCYSSVKGERPYVLGKGTPL